MEIEILDLNEKNGIWREFEYFMIPPLYGFAVIHVNSFESLVLGGKNG